MYWIPESVTFLPPLVMHMPRGSKLISLPWISCGDNFPLSLLPQSQRITCTRSLTLPMFPGWTSSVSKTDFSGSLENQLDMCVTCREARGCVDSLRCRVWHPSTGCVCWPCRQSVSQPNATPPRCSYRGSKGTELWSLHKHSSMSGNKWCCITIFVADCSVFTPPPPLIKFVSQCIISEAPQNFMHSNRILMLKSKSDTIIWHGCHIILHHN